MSIPVDKYGRSQALASAPDRGGVTNVASMQSGRGDMGVDGVSW